MSESCDCVSKVGVVINGENVSIYDEGQSCVNCDREAIENLRESVADLTNLVSQLQRQFITLVGIVGTLTDITKQHTINEHDSLIEQGR